MASARLLELAADAGASDGGWDPKATKLVLTWVAYPFPNEEASANPTGDPARTVELAVRAGTTLRRVRLPRTSGTMDPEGVSVCSKDKPKDHWWVRFDHGVAELYTATLIGPARLSIRSVYLTDGNCGDKPCPEQVLGQEVLQIPNLPVEERIRVVKSKGKERDFSCQSGEYDAIGE